MAALPRLLRMVHHDDRLAVSVATDPSNPLAVIPELPRVYQHTNRDGTTSLRPLPNQTDWLTMVRDTGLIFNSDLFYGQAGGDWNRPGLHNAWWALKIFEAQLRPFVNPASTWFITDFEGWQIPGNPHNEFQVWRSVMSAWSGPVGNYGNVSNRHVAPFLDWRGLDRLGPRGVVCPSAYNLGLSPKNTGESVQGRKSVAFIGDHCRMGDSMDQHFEAAVESGADYIVLWSTSPLHEPVFAHFTSDDLHAQAQRTARALTRVGYGGYI